MNLGKNHYNNIEQQNNPLTNEEQTTRIVNKPLNGQQQSDEIKETVPIVSIPRKINLPVPFICQAPSANWDDLHNEACEEAAIIMLHCFLQEMNLNSQL